jgi:hypothetical protein
VPGFSNEPAQDLKLFLVKGEAGVRVAQQRNANDARKAVSVAVGTIEDGYLRIVAAFDVGVEISAGQATLVDGHRVFS